MSSNDFFSAENYTTLIADAQMNKQQESTQGKWNGK